MRTRNIVAAVAFACSAAMSMHGVAVAAEKATAAGDNYPSRPVRWIVPYPPAGTTDILARIMSEWLTQRTGQQFVVDNRPGAGNNIGTEIAIKAAPDGYTVFLVNPANAINATLYQKLPFNFLRDMDPVAGLVRVPNVMETPVSFPAKTVKEFIEHAKKNPGKVNMASSGSGTSVHLSGELFKSMTGVQMQHIPYKGAGPALIDLMAGHVQVLIAALPGVVQQAREGRVRMIAQTGQKRSASMPDVPTVVESGLPGFVVSSHFGLLAPAGTPRAIVDRVRGALLDALNDAAVNTRLASLGAERVGSTPEEHDATTRAEIAKWIKVTRQAGIEPQ